MSHVPDPPSAIPAARLFSAQTATGEVHRKPDNKAKFGRILTKIKDFGVRLELCGKGDPSGSSRLGIKERTT
jgi:hypothetical protein